MPFNQEKELKDPGGVSGNTIINTTEGPVPIKEISVGEQVITHLGNNKAILQVYKEKIGNKALYGLNIYKCPPIKITGDHRLRVYDSTNQTVGWKAAKSLTIQDFISIPCNALRIDKSEKIYTVVLSEVLKDAEVKDYKMVYDDEKREQISLRYCYSQFNLNNGSKINLTLNKGKWVKNRIKIDENFMRFVGIYYGDGSIIPKTNTKGEKIPAGISISIHSKNEKLIDFCKKISSKFGINCLCTKLKNQNVVSVVYNSLTLGLFFKECFGKGFQGKKIWERFYSLSRPMIIALLEGLITTDGTVSSRGIIKLTMCNQKFMEDLYSLCRINKIAVGFPIAEKMGKLATCVPYTCTLTSIKAELNFILKTYTDDRVKNLKREIKGVDQRTRIINNEIFLRCAGKREIVSEEFVFNLGIEDDGSFSAAGIILQGASV